jgi:DHA3 family macrolide efflux protein-like MFS transporter
VPFILVSPIAGAMVDRYSRKLMMMLVESGPGVFSPILAGLLLPAIGLSGILAIGGVMGGAIISAWGGFKRKRIHGMFLGWGISGLLGLIGFGLGRGLAVWLPMAAVSAMAFPLSQSAGNTIWQSTVAPDIQGRVFSARRMLAWMVDPIMPVVAGLIADRVTEPAMRADTRPARTFSGITGGGPGSGMALQFVAAGMIYLVITVIVFATPAVRDSDQPRRRASGAPAVGRRGTFRPAYRATSANSSRTATMP